MRILFMGTPDFAAVSLKKLIDAGYDVCGAVTQPDKPKGRGQKLMFPPMKELALANGIEVYQPQTLKDGAFKDTLTEFKPDIIIVVAYGKILPKYILDFPKFGCINVHASLLPKYRGAAPIQRCVIDGEKESGVTTMYMAEGLDTGDMILKKSTPIGEYETAGELHDRLAVMGAELLIETIEKIAQGTALREVQDDTLSSYAAMMTKETGKIDWGMGARAIINLVRGTNPWPAAFCEYNGQRMKVFSCKMGTKKQGGRFGEILGITDGKLEVLAGDNVSVLIDEIQADGSKRMSVQSYLNGHEIKTGTILG